jgi:chromosome segregation protein
MKVDFVEVSGFRGFRETLRMDVASGFTVISGRNGIGKSTLCDAIEFAITGEIDKYRVERAGRETLDDYLWWRGDGSPSEQYVKVGFLGANGQPFVIRRSRDAGSDQTPDQIENMLCVAEANPVKPLQQLCRTSIIRDELIAALSLDLTETDRFDLVRSALGAVEDRDYAAKAKEVLSVAEAAQKNSEREYDSARIRLNQALTDLAETRDITMRSGDDVASALAVVEAESPNSAGDTARRIMTVRGQLARRRALLEAISPAVEEAKRIADRSAYLKSDQFRVSKSSAADAVATAESTLANAERELNEARRQIEIEQEADRLAASLAEILEHGARIGLNHGRCPLCDALRTEAEFEAGLARARARLNTLGSGVNAARARRREAEQQTASAEAGLRQAQEQLATLTNQETEFRNQEAAQIALLNRYGFDHALAADPILLETQLLAERSRLVDLERSIFVLEASHAISRVTELEARITGLRLELEAAAGRQEKALAGVSAAKTIEQSVKRASAEIVDERLAMISPLLNELYQRLQPHPDWREIEYNISGDVRRFLSLRVGDNLNPQFVFSSGQRRAAGLAFLLSVYLARPWSRWKTLVLDDPVQHIDDYRALHLVEVLAALKQAGRQIICAVEDASLADLLCRRLPSTPTDPGLRYDLDFDATGATIVGKRTEIMPMPIGVLRHVVETTAAS